MTTLRCYWCGRFGGHPTTYQLHVGTDVFTRDLCPPCAQMALGITQNTELRRAAEQWRPLVERAVAGAGLPESMVHQVMREIRVEA